MLVDEGSLQINQVLSHDNEAKLIHKIGRTTDLIEMSSK